MIPDRTAAPRPSVGYYLCLAAAMVGLVAVAIAIEATRRAAAGGDGQSALSGAGVPALILAWLAAYYARLAFWPRVSAKRQAAVAASLRVFMVAEIVAAIVGSWWVFSQPAADGIVWLGGRVPGMIVWRFVAGREERSGSTAAQGRRNSSMRRRLRWRW